MRVKNKNPSAFIYFLIGDTPMFSMSNRSTLIQDSILHGLDCMNRNVNNVNTLRCENASFTNPCLTQSYTDPAIIDNCCITQSVCLMNASIVNLDVSGNVSFVSLRNINTSIQNLNQHFTAFQLKMFRLINGDQMLHKIM